MTAPGFSSGDASGGTDFFFFFWGGGGVKMNIIVKKHCGGIWWAKSFFFLVGGTNATCPSPKWPSFAELYRFFAQIRTPIFVNRSTHAPPPPPHVPIITAAVLKEDSPRGSIDSSSSHHTLGARQGMILNLWWEEKNLYAIYAWIKFNYFWKTNPKWPSLTPSNFLPK